MLNAAREAPNVKFVVEDFFKDGDYAYLCAFTVRPDAQRHENYDRGDGDSFLISYFTFRREGGVWRVLDRGNDFTGAPNSRGRGADYCRVTIRNEFDIMKADLPKPF